MHPGAATHRQVLAPQLLGPKLKHIRVVAFDVDSKFRSLRACQCTFAHQILCTRILPHLGWKQQQTASLTTVANELGVCPVQIERHRPTDCFEAKPSRSRGRWRAHPALQRGRQDLRNLLSRQQVKSNKREVNVDAKNHLASFFLSKSTVLANETRSDYTHPLGQPLIQNVR